MGRPPPPPPTGASGTMQSLAMVAGKSVASAFFAGARWASTEGWAAALTQVAAKASAVMDFLILSMRGIEGFQSLGARAEFFFRQAVERHRNRVEVGMHVLG